MRNPLNAIISNCYLLENQDQIQEEVKSRLKIMRVSSNLLVSFVNDLMDWTMIKQNKFIKKEQNFNLKQMFIDVNEMMKFKANIKDIYCEVEFDQNVPTMVYGDDSRLMQVIINLISNSLKFTFVGGVTIKVGFELEKSLLYV